MGHPVVINIDDVRREVIMSKQLISILDKSKLGRML